MTLSTSASVWESTRVHVSFVIRGCTCRPQTSIFFCVCMKSSTHRIRYDKSRNKIAHVWNASSERTPETSINRTAMRLWHPCIHPFWNIQYIRALLQSNTEGSNRLPDLLLLTLLCLAITDSTARICTKTLLCVSKDLASTATKKSW